MMTWVILRSATLIWASHAFATGNQLVRHGEELQGPEILPSSWAAPQPFTISKQQAKSLSDTDIKKFCDYQNYIMTDDSHSGPQWNDNPKSQMNKSDLEDFLHSSDANSVFHQIRIPNSALRKATYNRNRNDSPPNRNESNFEYWRKATDPITGLKFLNELPDEPLESGFPEDLPNDSTLLLLCTAYGCPGAALPLKDMAHELAPESGIVDLKIVRRLLSDPVSIQVMAKAALTIDKKITAAAQGKPITGDVFNDILNAANVFVKNKSEARDLAWNILEIYGTRGANMSGLILLLRSVVYQYPSSKIPYSRQRLGISSLQGIATGMSVLDQFAEERRQRLYSLPPIVKFDCAYGKPYTFWMAASLARKAAKKYGKPYDAALAIHLSLLGYNFGAGARRDPSIPFTDTDDFGGYSNSVRMTIAYGDAGAIYGAYGIDGNEAPRALDIAAGFRYLMQNKKYRSKRLTLKEFNDQFQNPLTKMILFNDWRQFMGADLAFQFFKQQVIP